MNDRGGGDQDARGLALAARCHKMQPAVSPEDVELPVPVRIKYSFAAGVALVGLVSLTSCIPAVVGSTAATGGYVAGQERGVQTQLSDTVIRAQIVDKWARFSADMQHQLSISVYDGRVLITGAVSNPEWKTDAVRLAWEVKDVKEVNSEIELAANSGLGDTARDELITTRLRSAILFDRDIRSVNYTIDTVNGSVFLSGSARSQAELDKVTNYARNIPNVKRVVSYVRIRLGEPAPTDTSAQPSGATQDWPQPASQGNPASPASGAPAATGPSTTSPAGPAKIEVQPLQ